MLLERLDERPATLLYLERYVNEGTQTYSPHAGFSAVRAEYQPRIGLPRFGATSLLVPPERVAITRDNPDPALADFYLRENQVVLPLHPEVIADPSIRYVSELRQLPRAENLLVSPTASTRTVLVEEPTHRPHCVKLHLPRRISRFVRRFRRISVEFSVLISQDLRAFAAERWAYLPESIGIAYGSVADGWGAVIRELTPWPVVAEQRILVPCFSLYGGDRFAPGDPPLLTQLIEHHHADPVQFTLENLLLPLIRQWCQAFGERGIVLGCHAQNVLLELDARFQPRRIVHRDLDIQVDPRVRQAQGLSTDFPKSRIGIEIHEPIERALSLKYDLFMGHHFFDYVSRLLEQRYGVGPQTLWQACQATFRQAFPDANRYFDGHTYYYNPEVSPTNEFHLIDTGEPPHWR